jgi:oxygen-independent coproporphyrinogen-3 oxidase
MAGHACRYNLLTWAQGEYLAFGLGAHGHRSGARTWNVRRLDRYLERVEAGEDPESGGERLEDWAREQERVVLGLRRTAGVALGRAGAALVDSAPGERLIAAGVVHVDDERLVVTKPLLGDEVARNVLALEPADC